MRPRHQRVREARTTVESERPVAVIAAFAGNALITIAKGIAAVATGSGSLLAETAHSLADSLNQAFLYIGVRRSARGPSEQYPLGFGKERYFWALAVALMLFFGGGVFSLYEAWDRFNNPHELGNSLVGFGVLGVAAVFEGGSLAFAIHELVQAAHDEGRSVLGFLRVLPDPALRTVLFEDSAALIGIVFAVSGLAVSTATGDHIYDAIASAGIGLLLVGVAVALATDARGLIIGESPPDDVLDEIRSVLSADQRIESVVELSVVRMGVDRLLVLARLGLVDGLTTDEVEGALARARRALYEARTDIGDIYLEATAPTASRIDGPQARA